MCEPQAVRNWIKAKFQDWQDLFPLFVFLLIKRLWSPQFFLFKILFVRFTTTILRSMIFQGKNSEWVFGWVVLELLCTLEPCILTAFLIPDSQVAFLTFIFLKRKQMQHSCSLNIFCSVDCVFSLPHWGVWVFVIVTE